MNNRNLIFVFASALHHNLVDLSIYPRDEVPLDMFKKYIDDPKSELNS
jgi:hypothetical protein